MKKRYWSIALAGIVALAAVITAAVIVSRPGEQKENFAQKDSLKNITYENEEKDQKAEPSKTDVPDTADVPRDEGATGSTETAENKVFEKNEDETDATEIVVQETPDEKESPISSESSPAEDDTGDLKLSESARIELPFVPYKQN